MTHFLNKTLGAEEKLLCLARLHWIYVVSGVFWLAGMTGAGFYLDALLWRYFGSTAQNSGQTIFGLEFGADHPWITGMCLAAGLAIFLIHFLKVVATEIALTDQRLVYKTGWLFVDVKEIDLAEIRAEQVHHGLLGRIFGYGTLHLDSRFVGDIYLPAIRKPYDLLRKIHAARKKLHDPLDQ